MKESEFASEMLNDSALNDSALNNTVTTCDVSTISSFDTLSELSAGTDLLTSAVAVAEPAFSTIGLGGYWPIGLIQNALEFTHMNLGLPWWASIVCLTIVFRSLLFPLVVKGHTNAAKMNNVRGDAERLQQELREAIHTQDQPRQVAASDGMKKLYADAGVQPAKALLVPFIQMPFFISIFFGVKRMAYLPVESMKTGGIFWFEDLTLADPFFILPVVCAGTMWIAVETSADGKMSMSEDMVNKMKFFMRFACVSSLCITSTFPAALLVYWCTSNSYTLAQMIVLRNETVKTALGIPETVNQPTDPDVKVASFMENLKAGYKSAQESQRQQQINRIKEGEPFPSGSLMDQVKAGIRDAKEFQNNQEIKSELERKSSIIDVSEDKSSITDVSKTNPQDIDDKKDIDDDKDIDDENETRRKRIEQNEQLFRDAKKFFQDGEKKDQK